MGWGIKRQDVDQARPSPRPEPGSLHSPPHPLRWFLTARKSTQDAGSLQSQPGMHTLGLEARGTHDLATPAAWQRCPGCQDPPGPATASCSGTRMLRHTAEMVRRGRGCHAWSGIALELGRAIAGNVPPCTDGDRGGQRCCQHFCQHFCQHSLGTLRARLRPACPIDSSPAPRRSRASLHTPCSSHLLPSNPPPIKQSSRAGLTLSSCTGMGTVSRGRT